MAGTSHLARRQLDQRLSALAPLAAQGRPHRGWIRAIREALGMSTTELAARLEVAQSSVTALEQSEAHGTIKLDSLRRAADALDCDFVYALIPRTSLEDAVQAQAKARAARHLRKIAHHGRLEDQQIADEARQDQIDDLAAQLINRRGLWSPVE